MYIINFLLKVLLRINTDTKYQNISVLIMDRGEYIIQYIANISSFYFLLKIEIYKITINWWQNMKTCFWNYDSKQLSLYVWFLLVLRAKQKYISPLSLFFCSFILLLYKFFMCDEILLQNLLKVTLYFIIFLLYTIYLYTFILVILYTH